MARTPLYKAAETEMIRRIETGEWEVGTRPCPNEIRGWPRNSRSAPGTPWRPCADHARGMGLLEPQAQGRGTIVARSGKAPAGPAGRRDGAGSISKAPPWSSKFTARRKIGPEGARPKAEMALFAAPAVCQAYERLLKRGGRGGPGSEENRHPREPRARAGRGRASVAGRVFLSAHGPWEAAGMTEKRNKRRHHVQLPESVSAVLRPATPRCWFITRTAHMT